MNRILFNTSVTVELPRVMLRMRRLIDLPQHFPHGGKSKCRLLHVHGKSGNVITILHGYYLPI